MIESLLFQTFEIICFCINAMHSLAHLTPSVNACERKLSMLLMCLFTEIASNSAKVIFLFHFSSARKEPLGLMSRAQFVFLLTHNIIYW